jgi:hypothetical protein
MGGSTDRYARAIRRSCAHNQPVAPVLRGGALRGRLPGGCDDYSEEGINEMTTTAASAPYCSNNRPYKVRRFNFLQLGQTRRDQMITTRT